MSQAERTNSHGTINVTAQDRTVDMLVERLQSGDTALARRRDLGELHKHLVGMVSSMTNGLGEAQAKRDQRHERAMSGRFDELAKAVNGLESALRIELEPMLKRSLSSVSAPPAPRRPRRGLFTVLGFVAGFGAAVAFSDRLPSDLATLTDMLGTRLEKLGDLSPNGGSPRAVTPVE